jgi:MoxR-like ATPase
MKATVLPLEPLVLSFDLHTGTLPSLPKTPLALDQVDDLELFHRLQETLSDRFSTSLLLPLLEPNLRWIRYGLEHLLHGVDSLAAKLHRCLFPGESYFVPGWGLECWSKSLSLVSPESFVPWTRQADRGLVRLGLLPSGERSRAVRYPRYLQAIRTLERAHPESRDTVRFLEAVALLRGRELDLNRNHFVEETIQETIRQLRIKTPLRNRLKQAKQSPPAQAEPLWNERSQRAWRLLCEGLELLPCLPEFEAFFQAIITAFRERFGLHPLECDDLWDRLAERLAASPEVENRFRFSGFSRDSFRFLNELEADNRSNWMAANRERYAFVIRDPLRELSYHLTERYLEPVLRKGLGWDLETEPRTGKSLSSIVKNDYGQSVPYQTSMWLSYFRSQSRGKRDEVQWFVKLDSSGIAFGFLLGKSAREAGQRFRHALQQLGDSVFRNLALEGSWHEIEFLRDGETVSVSDASSLRNWATGKTLLCQRKVSREAPQLLQDDLVGEILLTWDRLLPLFYVAMEAAPGEWLSRRLGSLSGEIEFDREAFRRESDLPESWLDRALELLQLKKQLILQGVPGTGKTHIARLLARWLTRDRSERVQLVQFHPSYCYEEFVEGIKPRAVEINGRSEVTYPVERGVLLEFAERASQEPSQPFVLLIDEINRGNLPRIFGELLYLLEYRQQAVSLPYSRQLFRLPANLYLIGTMNGADRSVLHLDQALRRRFSFLDMAPDARVLIRWLERHPPREGELFAHRVVRLFELLNEKLTKDLGTTQQIGHSYFMVPNLDASRLQLIWDHHVRPQLLESFASNPQRVNEYEFETLLKRASVKSQ